MLRDGGGADTLIGLAGADRLYGGGGDRPSPAAAASDDDDGDRDD